METPLCGYRREPCHPERNVVESKDPVLRFGEKLRFARKTKGKTGKNEGCAYKKLYKRVLYA